MQIVAVCNGGICSTNSQLKQMRYQGYLHSLYVAYTTSLNVWIIFQFQKFDIVFVVTWKVNNYWWIGIGNIATHFHRQLEQNSLQFCTSSIYCQMTKLYSFLLKFKFVWRLTVYNHSSGHIIALFLWNVFYMFLFVLFILVRLPSQYTICNLQLKDTLETCQHVIWVDIHLLSKQ